MIKVVIVQEEEMHIYHEFGSFQPSEVENLINLFKKYGVVFEDNKHEHRKFYSANFNATTRNLELIVGPER